LAQPTAKSNQNEGVMMNHGFLGVPNSPGNISPKYLFGDLVSSIKEDHSMHKCKLREHTPSQKHVNKNISDHHRNRDAKLNRRLRLFPIRESFFS